MSFVNAQFVLPSVTQANGSIALLPPLAGRCPVTIKKRVQSSSTRFATSRRSNVIRPSHGYRQLSGFFDSIVGVAKGVVTGFAAGGPVGAVAGGAIGGVAGATKGSGSKGQQVAAPPSGPLANVSTSTLVVGGMAFTGLILALAGGRR